ncbi:MAG: lipopolysaccharide biosynthesis protein [Proteobacteria bacterium]|nr:lipopolysaccharide biosynthesis protein [Pseudomonadota bacterium]
MRSASSARSPEHELGVDHLTADLGRRSRRGGVVLMAAQGVRVLGQMATLVVLARLLPPSAFGLLAMVAAIGAILDLVKEFGLSAATIQRQDVTHAQVSALFWINAGVGAMLGLGLFACAPLLAHFYGQPELTDVARWLALAFVASGLTVQHWALLRRQMRFAAIAGIETMADLLAFATAIGLALYGAGYWALVAQRLVSPLFLMAATWIVCRWRPARPARTEGVRSLLGYGASVTGSGLATAFSRSIDQILIGWLWGPAALGLYERTTRLLLMPVNTINAPVYAAAMPALSRLNDDPVRYRQVFGQVMQKLALLTMPAFALAAVTADWLVAILFGPSWKEATPLVALFSVSALYLPTLLAAGLLYMSQARTGEMLRATLIDTGLCVASIVGGLHWGTTGVAAALALVGITLRLPVGLWLAARHGPVRTAQIWRAIAPPASAAAAVAAAAMLVRRVEPAPTLTGIVAVGAAALLSVLLVLLAWPETRRELLSLMTLPARRLRPT